MRLRIEQRLYDYHIQSSNQSCEQFVCSKIIQQRNQMGLFRFYIASHDGIERANKSDTRRHSRFSFRFESIGCPFNNKNELSTWFEKLIGLKVQASLFRLCIAIGVKQRTTFTRRLIPICRLVSNEIGEELKNMQTMEDQKMRTRSIRGLYGVGHFASNQLNIHLRTKTL